MKNFFAGLFIILVALEGWQLFTESTLFTSSMANFLFDYNFHKVIDNRLYRAGEMPEPALEKTIKTYNIKTVVDLRHNKDKPNHSGKTEQQVVENTGAKYVHVPMVGSRIPTKNTIADLLQTFDTAQTPILVHCSSGTHRSGVASAIWLLTEESKDLESAKDQLTARYGFFKIERELKSLIYGHSTIDGLLWNYEEANKKTGVAFRDWVNQY